MGNKLEDQVFAFCACEHASLEEVWAEIEAALCSRKGAPPRILLDLQRALYYHGDLESEQFVERFRRGLWAELLKTGGRLAVVIGKQDHVCVTGPVELLQSLANLSDTMDSVRLLPTTKLAVRWLAREHVQAA